MVSLPKELMPQITPCTKILCSYSAISAPTQPASTISCLSGECARKRKGLTKSSGRQQREHNTVTRSIPLEHLTLNQRLTRARPQLLPHLLLRLTKRQRLGLREEVREEDTVVLRVANGVVSGSGGEEVGGDELGALVHELVEGVLAVGASRAPDDRLDTRSQYGEEGEIEGKGLTPV